jgi:class 3 adenylate cyclase/tetratricopeptide (TPR) repeat protein
MRRVRRAGDSRAFENCPATRSRLDDFASPGPRPDLHERYARWVTTCSACGAGNADPARFCARCGATIGAVCPSCGAPVASDDRFCSNCGTTLATPTPIGDERKLVTVLFADVTGSTALGERLDPERMRDVLRTYFAAMREEIEGEGGTVEKFIGDAVMAAFGVPVAHEDDPARALRAAGAMLRRLDSVNAELTREHGVSLEIRIGVNTGEVLATTDPRPGEPMVTGDAVNAAARLEAAAAPGQVIASERTVRAVRGFRLEPIGLLELRGKAEPTHAYRVLGEQAEAERGIPGLSAPMIGRSGERDLLLSIAQRVAADRRPHLVTIYGEAGVGKSRLTREFLRGLGGEDLVMVGRCLPQANGVTFWPLAEILKNHAGVLDTDSWHVALDRIRAAGRELLTNDVTDDPARTTAALAFTVGVEDPAFAPASMDPKAVRAEVHKAWRSFFSALSTHRLVVVVIEDIHWAEPALLDLLEDLAERVLGPMLLVCLARPELNARRPAWGGGRGNHTAASLDPLTSEQSNDLVTQLLAIDNLPIALRRRILERAEGNPFFIEEIVRHLIDRGIIVRDTAEWRATDDIDSVNIPDTVQGVLAARIDFLEPAQKRVLQAAAVVGRVFWPGPVRQLLNGNRADLEDALTTLQSRDLVLSRLGSAIRGEPEYMFKHILTRDVAYQSLPRRERASAHAAVAGWLESIAGGRSREFVELLAYHYATSVSESPRANESLRRKAFDHLLAASDDNRSKQVLKKAQRLAQQALDLAASEHERAQALEALADAFFAAYDGDPAWRFYREAALAKAQALPPDPIKVAYLAARACEIALRWPGSMRANPSEDAVRAMLDLCADNLPEEDSEERVMFLSHQASWLFAFPDETVGESELETVRDSALEAAEMALRLDLPDLASAAFDAAAGPAGAAGRYDTALEVWLRRSTLVPRLTDVLEIGDCYAMGSWGLFELGRYPEARQVALEGLSKVAGLAASAEVHLLSWLVVTLMQLGEWDEALLRFERVRELLDERRDNPPYFATPAYAATAIIHDARGEQLECDRITDQLLAIASPGSGRLHPWLTRLLVERGEVERARAYFTRRPPGWRGSIAQELAIRCELVAALGAWNEAPEASREARDQAAFGAAALPPVADLLDGRALLAAGTGSAVEPLQRAVSGFVALHTPWEEARTRVDLARAQLAAGCADDAAAQLDTAETMFNGLLAAKDLTVLRAFRTSELR